jgi:hypothetical protein
MSTTANAVKANLEIVANLVDSNGHKHAVPDIHNPMKFEDTVHYSSPDGEVTIEFRDDNGNPTRSPFLNPNGSEKVDISSNEPPIMLSKKGTFVCHCFITPPGKAKADRIGWDKLNSPQSGGNHVVQ